MSVALVVKTSTSLASTASTPSPSPSTTTTTATTTTTTRRGERTAGARISGARWLTAVRVYYS